jgi:hypothetical protein
MWRYILCGVWVVSAVCSAEATIYETNPSYPDILLTLTISSTLACVYDDALDSTATGGWWRTPDSQGHGGSPGTGSLSPAGRRGSDSGELASSPLVGGLGDRGELDSWFTLAITGNAGGGMSVFYPNPLSMPPAPWPGSPRDWPPLTSFDQASVLFHFHISYYLAEPGNVTLTVHSMEGKQVKTLVAHPQSGGWNHLIWDGTDSVGRKVGAGVYVCHLESE